MNKHPLNTGFTWQQPEPPYQIITDQQAHDYAESGGFVFENAFSVVELAPVIEELDAIEAQMNEAIRDLPADQPSIARADEIVFSAHVVQSSAAARALSHHEVLQKLCRDLIGPEVRLYWDQLVYKRGGTEAEFPWHQDNGYNFVQPQQYLTCWLALNDATIENGCPWIAPGVHRHGTLHHQWTPLGFQCMETPADARPLPLTAGSMAVFSSLTPHRTGPNLTSGIRRAYILQYAPEGARVYPRQGADFAANDPDRQYLITA